MTQRQAPRIVVDVSTTDTKEHDMIPQSSTYATADGFAAMLKHRTTEYLQDCLRALALSGVGGLDEQVQQIRSEIASRVSS